MQPITTQQIEAGYALAKERYAALGVDTEAAMTALAAIPIALHAWQGDDVRGFESADAQLTGGGIQATGNYPGRARTADELRADLDQALRLIPGKHRVNLQAIQGDFGGKVERNNMRPEHFSRWMDWAKERGLGLDFNPSYFSHPKADDGFTLTSRDEGNRQFWIEHGIASRKIGEAFGKALGTPCVTNIWIPDGSKDIPVDRKSPRELLARSLDAILAEKLDSRYNLDAVEGKLFGLGLESYTAGSHEFYLGYAVTRKILLCYDTGHFHPTEVVSDKLSAALTFLDQMLLHISRGVRWDSDHVVILSDELQAIAQELVRGKYLNRVHISLDFFDASMNRVAAWVIGARSMLKALLLALLEPFESLRTFENAGDYTARLAMLEELKTLPFGTVWDYYCLKQSAPVGAQWLDEVKQYEKTVLAQRG
ncbi:L-rhamnose isomerase [Candidatus Moduliflexus flocculans]|uniref:L-rhamnose isomerase n=1 Tax=Candidatus Moduliflexus flocculans TaxID=1499966 RepID=A0A081BMR1_9BACT|nr:L-rhamnose isomerase [Candidatus Moduliflexus flocculans]